jgi:hypothetical protein
VAEDGRGESIWDRFCATPGKVRNGESGAVACDFYHRYGEDIELMKDLGVAQKRSQMLSPRPSSATAPSSWYEAEETPQRKPGGKRAE